MTRHWWVLATAVACLTAAGPAAAHDRGNPPTSPRLHAQAAHGHSGQGTPPLGTVRAWPDVTYDGEQIVLKDFALRGVGPHIEVWVGVDLPVESDECRSSNAANLVITDAQVGYLIWQFERRIRPLEARLFGVPRPRDGSAAQPDVLGLSIPADAFRGDGDHLVVLVDNFRSGGWTLTLDQQATDRNVVAIKAQGWPNSEGPHPLDLGPDPCRTLNGYAVPNMEEALLAHEYNHLTKENRGGAGSLGATAPWITEGVAEWAAVKAGYVDPSEDSVANFVVACFLGRQAQAFPSGWLDPSGAQVGGPENSLSSFGDPGQGSDCEYGPPKTLMLFLASRYGPSFLRDLLYTSGTSGIADGLVPTLARYGSHQSAAETLQDWSTMLALDGVLDDGARLIGADPRRFEQLQLHASPNLETPFAYAAPGAPPNGADFVRLRTASSAPVSSDAIESLRFDAPNIYPPAPVEWSVDPDGHAPGDAALYSGSGDSTTDRAIVRSVAVDPANPTLSFDARYDTEPDYDYAFVQVSTDGGASYHSRPATTTRADAASDADARITAELPGFNGDSGGWVHETVDLTDLAGQNILVAFRLMTDVFVNQPGLWIDNVMIGGTSVSDGSTLDGWQTFTEIKPIPIAGISARLVAYDRHHRRAGIVDVRLDSFNDGALTAAQLKILRDLRADTVVAIVNHYEPTERISQGAPYALTVNGVLQPGG
jgi:hypothetical protein